MAIAPEAMLISAVINEKSYEAALAAGVNTQMMGDGYREEWEWIESYWKKHRRSPSRLAFKNHFDDFPLRRVDDTDHFIDEVRRAHSRRVLTAAMSETADLISAGNITGAVAYFTSSANIVAAQMGVTDDIDIFNDWEGVLQDAQDRRERFEEFGMSGIPTGFETLDERTGGIGLGQHWVVAARLGEKKSWTLLKMACAAVMAGFNVHYAALEMTRTEVSMRVHTILSGKIGKQIFESQMLLQGKEPDMRAYGEFLRGLKSHIKANFTVSDKRGIGISDILAQIERHRPDLYCLDYLTLAESGGSGDWMDIGKFSKDLCQIGGDRQIGMLSAAQLNRNAASVAMGKKNMDPADSDTLGRSDSIGQDADAVITSKQISPRVNVYKLSKSRHSQAGFKWYTQFEPDKGVFDEVSYNKAMELVDADRALESKRSES